MIQQLPLFISNLSLEPGMAEIHKQKCRGGEGGLKLSKNNFKVKSIYSSVKQHLTCDPLFLVDISDLLK